MRQTFGWPCWSYRSRQPGKGRAILSFCRLCYQQGRCYRMCLVGVEVDDVAVIGRWNQCQRLHFISESQMGWGRGKRRVKAEELGDWATRWLSRCWHWGCNVLSLQRLLLCVWVHRLGPKMVHQVLQIWFGLGRGHFPWKDAFVPSIPVRLQVKLCAES